ncbi:membrane-bound lytic murein transglycosylase B [Streptomyces sp. Amel2xB2]|uniref:lytic transglycosylase domain-containing protein n=1 Tax=Streptomyces sp. Amel2xB2 TaxID=1305829 RepID=UPI000DBF4CFE|nr:lytic murein transglycosylase [Streptomyces sp. Amel2xB2]RAJ65583.1 membrane-bound lytic murein transglycosylase B [Streptomyces sp. Amel2xB2]
MARYQRFRGGGRKLRRGVTGTAIAAATMAALTASQAPGADVDHRTDGPGTERADDARPDQAPGDDSYHTELPPLESPAPPRSSPDPSPSESGIPATLLAAYKQAARSLGTSDPACGLRWELLAAIGKVESGQARGGAVDKDGTTLKPILGPVLNGSGFARITDTDGGRLDGDKRFDRAVGPLQFIPSTWARWSADGNGDGRRDPANIHDASLAAARYLCAGERDLGSKTGLHRAVLSYNDSRAYLRTVLAWYDFYRKGTHKVPDGSGAVPTTPGAGGADDSGKGGGGSHGGSKPHKPGKGGGHEGGHGGGDGGQGGGGGDQSPAPGTLKPVLAGELTAYTGGSFEERPRVRAAGKSGKALKGVRIEYTIKGATDARFTDGSAKATATTGADGTATAPVVEAGGTAGEFTITAKATGRDLTTTAMKATVEPKYTFARRPGGPLKAPVDAKFEDVEVTLAHEKEAAGDVPVTATMITEDGEENTKGPYFTDLFGNEDRSITKSTGGLLGRKGVLELPAIHTDGHTGTFVLRLTTEDGSTYDIDLTVTE